MVYEPSSDAGQNTVHDQDKNICQMRIKNVYFGSIKINVISDKGYCRGGRPVAPAVDINKYFVIYN